MKNKNTSKKIIASLGAGLIGTIVLLNSTETIASNTNVDLKIKTGSGKLLKTKILKKKLNSKIIKKVELKKTNTFSGKLLEKTGTGEIKNSNFGTGLLEGSGNFLENTGTGENKRIPEYGSGELKNPNFGTGLINKKNIKKEKKYDTKTSAS
ncbi:MAG: hypothetical protein PHG82_05735 [Candidatus Gracilibacteria bacterium]|nr:hypothetical protein [Candidatus Gracilibacteria bacterium]